MRTATRELLLEAAIEVIESEGEQAVKVRDIATRAGVTEPSLYHFFGDRNGLIEQAQAERFRRNQMDVLAGFAAAILECDSRDEFVELVRNAFTAAIAPERAHQRSTRVNVLGSTLGRPGLQELLAQQQRDVVKVVGDAMRVAQKLGYVRPDVDCHALTLWTIGMSQGRMLLEMDPAVVDGDAWDRVAIDALLSATGNPPAGLGDW